MPKRIAPLSARSVAALKSRGPGRYTVGGVDGLHLRVMANGSQLWILRIVTLEKKRRDFSLGSYPTVGLAEAREKAHNIRTSILMGLEPEGIRKRRPDTGPSPENRTKTFKECALAVIDVKSPEWRSAKHRQQWENTLNQYAFPIIGEMAVEDVETNHILEILEPIWRVKTETASRLRGRLEAVLDWARARELRIGENPARWRGHLDTLLPAPSKMREVKHHRAMEIKALPRFWSQLDQRSGIAAKALQFLILTAARSGEVRGATWDEINFNQKVWEIPAERMKAGVAHRVPLSTSALKLLKSLPILSGSPYVFPAPRGGQLSDMSLTAVMRRMKRTEVPHGFRSTFRDWAGDYTNFPRELAEQALAHTLRNKVEAAYRRSDALERRRQMLEEWANFITQKQ